MSFFKKISEGLKKTKDNMMKSVDNLLINFKKIDEELFEQLEETLIMADVGMETSIKICDNLRNIVKKEKITDPNEIKNLLKEEIKLILGETIPLDLSTTPSVILVIGVNGAGKTTAIGKLAANLKAQGKKVILGAADTFRAAAIDQLEEWARRAGVDVIKQKEGADPAAVVFDTINAAKSRGVDVVICDTAGRLHNKKNLMAELEKISRVIKREAPNSATETILVLDATTGQNAVIQAKLFNETSQITGLILSKLDGTAKGGIIIAIKDMLNLPVKYVSVGEKIDDLQEFDPSDYVNALFD
ncbi:MAG: signal recognition particle-docking protein FtsY [Oscillospiraceae bacterium]